MVAPLTPSAPYTPISAVHPGVASLYSSPLNSSQHGSPRSGLFAARAPVAGPRGPAVYVPPRDRLQEVDLRAEIEKHKMNLMQDD